MSLLMIVCPRGGVPAPAYCGGVSVGGSLSRGWVPEWRPPAVTAAVDTHPTGMHSCSSL